jgi:hypothetical protein
MGLKMLCERCHKQTDIIRHMKIKDKVSKVFKHNQAKDTMICITCYNDGREFYPDIAYLVETIRNG